MSDEALEGHYRRLYEGAAARIAAGLAECDGWIDSAADDRRGVTLLVKPSAEVKERIAAFLELLRAAEPDQYYYPESDIHLTVLSLITCCSGFREESISVPDYVQVIESCLAGMPEVRIHFRGVTASPSCVMAAGYPDSGALNGLRDRLRAAFAGAGLRQSLDSRYRLETAHSTVVRFRSRLRDPRGFVGLLERFRGYDFGCFRVGEYELVANDWYQRAGSRRSLHIFGAVQG